jgi:hypothetical protein
MYNLGIKKTIKHTRRGTISRWNLLATKVENPFSSVLKPEADIPEMSINIGIPI